MEITVDVEDMTTGIHTDTKQLTLTVMGMTVDAGMTTDIATKKNMHMHTETIVDADMTMMITDRAMPMLSRAYTRAKFIMVKFRLHTQQASRNNPGCRHCIPI